MNWDYDHPIDWADWSDERRAAWYTRERVRHQHQRQSRVGVEDRIDVHDRRKTTLFCTACGHEHEFAPDEPANYCAACGHEL